MRAGRGADLNPFQATIYHSKSMPYLYTLSYSSGSAKEPHRESRAKARLSDRNPSSLSWRYVLERAKRWAGELYTAEKAARFHASAGWLQKVLNRRNYTFATMRGEAGEVDEEYERREMAKFKKELEALCEKVGVTHISYILNADQTGIFYNQVPTGTFVSKSRERLIHGVKRMKDKERITFMLCTAADGSKCPGFVVGTAKHPKCFDLSPTIPVGYTHQQCALPVAWTAWFDKTVMLYWLNNVLMPWWRRHKGTQELVLILDNYKVRRTRTSTKTPHSRRSCM